MSAVTEPVWLTSAKQVTEQVIAWNSAETLFVDTEFHRERTFFPILALIQIFDGKQTFFIEPEAAANSDEFKALLEDPQVRKVFHSASEDCEVLFRALGVVLSNLWDTQIAASYLGMGLHLGYGQLVDNLLGIVLEKAEARSDWLQRPLTEKQVIYACDDVTYLSQCYQKQLAQLALVQVHLSRVEQDSTQLARRVIGLDDIDNAYLDVKNAWRLNQEQLYRLQVLATWREHTARESDQPRPFIANNQVLFELAQKGLDNREQLPFVKDWHPAAKRKYAAPMVKCLLELAENGVEEYLEQPLSPGFWQSYTQKMQRARDKMIAIAKEQQLDIDLLCSKKLLRGYVKFLIHKSSKPPRSWTQWREELLGDVLREVFASDRPGV